MNMQSKREYLNVLRTKYHQAKRKKTKTEIIDELSQNVGYSRKYAIHKLNTVKDPIAKNYTRKRVRTYNSDLKAPLQLIWETLNKPCSKRLRPMIPEMLTVLERCGELRVSRIQQDLLVKMGTWTIDNLLRSERSKFAKGIGGTKPSSYLLNKKIKIRVNFDDISEPGHLEIDTVHHCGERLEGKYAVTLNHIDIETLWSEQECFLSCLRRKVISGFDSTRKRLPFRVKSVDFDNGGEFKNHEFVKYCERNKIDTTRSRSYMKNDQCYVEGNNYVDVRELIGYGRYEREEEISLINDIYRNEHRLLNNFFYPSMKLIEKERNGGKVTKKYDEAKTPLRRVLESRITKEAKRKELIAEYEELNPVQLRRDLAKKLKKLAELSRVRKLDQAMINVRYDF